MKLCNMKNGSKCKIVSVKGDLSFQTRITSVGVLPGSEIEIVQNSGKRPLLVYVKNTLLALGRKQCDFIEVEELS